MLQAFKELHILCAIISKPTATVSHADEIVAFWLYKIFEQNLCQGTNFTFQSCRRVTVVFARLKCLKLTFTVSVEIKKIRIITPECAKH